jgi:putative ABC transport system permease protein
MSVNLGFVPQNLLTFQLSLPPQKYEATAGLNMLDRFRDAVAAIPGVEDAAYVNSAPLVTTATQSFYRAQDDMRDVKNLHDADMYMTTPPYLDTMKITLLRGRFLTDSDRANTSKVVVVDDNLAKQIFPGEDPIGKRIKFGRNEDPLLLEIIGVVGHIRQSGLDEANSVNMQFYMPITQAPPEYLGDALRGMSFVVRSTGSPESVAESVRAKLAQIDSSQPLYEMKTYEQLVKDHSEVQRFTASLLTAFAGIAVLLAAIGIYGVLSYAVEQRVHEIGIRMALGAGGADVLRIILGQAMATVLAGIGLGSIAALALTRFMNSVLFGVRAWDPMVFGGIALLLLTVALLASYLPARRATKVDPMVALRYD